jgi:hypothetical protein
MGQESWAECLLFQPLPAGGGLLAGMVPLWACSEESGSVWDWQRCWCPSRIMVMLLALAGAWLWCFHVYFPALLKRGRRPWPRTAFGRALALFWLLAAVAFVVLFAGLSDELRQAPKPFLPPSGSWLNAHWRWLALLVIGTVGAWLILVTVRHHERDKP